ASAPSATPATGPAATIPTAAPAPESRIADGDVMARATPEVRKRSRNDTTRSVPPGPQGEPSQVRVGLDRLVVEPQRSRRARRVPLGAVRVVGLAGIAALAVPEQADAAGTVGGHLDGHEE